MRVKTSCGHDFFGPHATGEFFAAPEDQVPQEIICPGGSSELSLEEFVDWLEKAGYLDGR